MTAARGAVCAVRREQLMEGPQQKSVPEARHAPRMVMLTPGRRGEVFCFLLFKGFIYLFERETERALASSGEEQRGRERGARAGLHLTTLR